MGNNHQAVSFDSVEDFVTAMQQSEHAHLDAFASFIGETRYLGVTLRELLATKDWAKFARAYNGPGYRANKHDEKLHAAYESAKARIG